MTQLNEQAATARSIQINKIKEDRKLHMSCTEMHPTPINKPVFNNKTKEGELFEP